MALFEDEIFDEELYEKPNKYLENPQWGLSLIYQILNSSKRIAGENEFENIILAEILPILAELELENELEIYRKLKKIIGKVNEHKIIEILEGKKILGVGGRFSAGKSCFINSLTHAALPEDQRPTTSIATYIVGADCEEYTALTNNDNLLELEEEAVSALTHKFYEKYEIGFSRHIKSLVIHVPGFGYSNIALLDTPGYSKADESKDDASDAKLAREHLKSVDYLIWLIDSVQGVITERDLEFISSLNVQSEILVVYTKADCEEKSNLERKIKEAKKLMGLSGKKVYDVIAYDSLSGETIIGGKSLENYLNKINGDCVENSNVTDEIKMLWKTLKIQLNQQLAELEKVKIEYEKLLEEIVEVDHIMSIVCEYGKVRYEYNRVHECKEKLKDCFKRLYNNTVNLR